MTYFKNFLRRNRSKRIHSGDQSPNHWIMVTACLTMTVSAVAATVSAPLYRVPLVQNLTKAINYRSLKSTAIIDFKGTPLSAESRGLAEIRSRAGATEIDATFEDLPAASRFGTEYLTYVLWAISPEGRPANLGELIIKDGKGQLKVTEQLQAFGLLVTAEPYFAVSAPSNLVVMENAVRKDIKGKIESVDSKYQSLEPGHYQNNIVPSDLGLPMDKKTPLAIYEARNAVRIAKASGAETYATDAFNASQALLAQAETKGVAKKERSSIAREAVKRAEDARSVSFKRQEANDLAKEKQDAKDQIGVAKNAATNAELAKLQAEVAKGQSETLRLSAETDRGTAERSRSQASTEAR